MQKKKGKRRKDERNAHILKYNGNVNILSNHWVNCSFPVIETGLAADASGREGQINASLKPNQGSVCRRLITPHSWSRSNPTIPRFSIFGVSFFS
jgi:hypothetical protein